ncbi:MAG: hypothetical protein IPG45_24445 [Deltaproteobacteria bacterium]|nr:hypothetical protein [Deltaproteobacteria bacterium]
MRGLWVLVLGLLMACAQEINTLEPDGGTPSDGSANDLGTALDLGTSIDLGTSTDAEPGPGDAEPQDQGVGDAGGPWRVEVTQLVVPGLSNVATAIFGRSATELYVGSGSGRIYRYDGANWTLAWSSPSNNGIDELHGTAAHFYSIDRQNFWVHSGPAPTSDAVGHLGMGIGQNGFRDLDGLSDDAIFMVGDQQNGGSGFYQWNGSALNRITVVNVAELTGVLALSPDEVLIAGTGRVYRYEGGGLTEEQVEWPANFTPTDIAYYTFHGLDRAGDRVFISAKEQAILERGADRIWRRVHEPGGTEPLFAIAGHGQRPQLQALAVGGNATASGPILLNDGNGWRSAGVRTNYRLFDLYSPSPGLYFAPGSVQNTVEGVVLRLSVVQ